MKPVEVKTDAIEEERQNAQREAMKPFRGLAESMMEHPELTAEEIQAQEDITKVIRRIPILNAQPKVMTHPLQDFGTLFDTMLGGMKLGIELVIAFGLVATPAVLEISEGNNYLQMEDTPFAAHVTDTAVDTLRLKKGEEIKFIPVTYNALDNVDGVKPELYEVQYKAAVREINKRKLPRRMAVGDLLFTTNGFKIILSPIQFTGLQVWLLTLANGSIERSEDDGAILQGIGNLLTDYHLRNMKMKTINLSFFLSQIRKDFRYILPR
ncbi:hypothetical protein SPFM15_00228 [Salmonella phage SPFM15]|nr:hypothetical protein SPFM5_00223 [Salmonella phage SPFM5]VFR13852.1 hypothetical protein SPFM15_00228 [Salmonella phage SPFM15]